METKSSIKHSDGFKNIDLIEKDEYFEEDILFLKKNRVKPNMIKARVKKELICEYDENAIEILPNLLFYLKINNYFYIF